MCRSQANDRKRRSSTPSKPVGSYISTLGHTTIARMYHFEVMLLPDGRVLISGSDPQTPGLPEEPRIEVYNPHS
jgi:hypothetical protein